MSNEKLVESTHPFLTWPQAIWGRNAMIFNRGTIQFDHFAFSVFKYTIPHHRQTNKVTLSRIDHFETFS
jgi:hypothetical protein